jgi:phosphomevalonate kinase
VLRPNGKAILIPTKKGITITASFRQRFRIRNRQFVNDNQSYTQASEIRNPRMRLAIEVVRIYLEHLGHTWRPFSLIVTSDISMQDEKYGFGSSGALVVATIGAILKLYRIKLSSLDVYKLSVKAMMSGFSNSSFADLAVSSFQQPILYGRFSESAFTYVQTHFTPHILLQPWDGLHIEPIQFNTHDLRVVFTGVSSDSTPLVESALPHLDEMWIQRSNDGVYQWIKQPESAKLSASSAHLLLLDKQASIGMFNDPIVRILSWANHHGLDAKFSGAGGGDCVLIRASDAQWDNVKKQLPHPAKVLSDII